MQKLLIEYQKYIEESLSENTMFSYMSDLKNFLSKNSINSQKELSKLRYENVEGYIMILRNSGMAYSSISRNIASLRKFFCFCVEKGIMKSDLTDEIKLPNKQRKLPNTISPDEVVKLLESPDISTIKGIRDKAMLELMYATGARVSEIINLRINDISLKNEMVMLSTSGKHRFVPLGRIAIDALLNYVKDARDKFTPLGDSGYLFLNFSGKPLSRQGFWKIIKHYIELCGIGGNVTAQTLRHSFALHLLKNGADIESVTEMLGYSDVSSTKIYIDVMNNKIKEVYQNAHPRA